MDMFQSMPEDMRNNLINQSLNNPNLMNNSQNLFNAQQPKVSDLSSIQFLREEGNNLY